LSGPLNGMDRNGIGGIAPIRLTGRILGGHTPTGMTIGRGTAMTSGFMTSTIVARVEVGTEAIMATTDHWL
jgi:hypothetical protein